MWRRECGGQGVEESIARELRSTSLDSVSLGLKNGARTHGFQTTIMPRRSLGRNVTRAPEPHATYYGDLAAEGSRLVRRPLGLLSPDLELETH